MTELTVDHHPSLYSYYVIVGAGDPTKGRMHAHHPLSPFHISLNAEHELLLLNQLH